MKLTRDILISSLILFSGITLLFLTSRESNRVAAPKGQFLSPPKELKFFSLGYQENISDILWLRLVQDMDFCDTKSLESLEGSQKAETTNSNSHLCNISNGWVYRMLDAITILTPNFRSPYIYGSTMLSVIVNDITGATIMFDRAVTAYPQDWQILYRAAYHELIENKNNEKAADLLVKAGNSGAPGWVYSLAAKLYTKEGKAALAASVIQEVLNSDPESRWAPRLRERLADINKEAGRN